MDSKNNESLLRALHLKENKVWVLKFIFDQFAIILL